MTAPTLEEVQRKISTNAITITLFDQEYPLAKTPAGPGLQAYMSFIARRKENVWDWAVKNPSPVLPDGEVDKLTPEELSDYRDKLTTYENQLSAISKRVEVDDTKDLVIALFYSLARLDPSWSLVVVDALLDASNKGYVADKLIEVNTVTKDKLPPNLEPVEAPAA